MSKGNIYVKNTAEETAVSNDILKVSTFCQKPLKVLDMTPSQKNIPFQAAKRSTGHGQGQAVLYEDGISLSFLTTFFTFLSLSSLMVTDYLI